MKKKGHFIQRVFLVVLYSLACICSWAGPRSYSQAKAIAMKKAAEIGLQVVGNDLQDVPAKGIDGSVGMQRACYVFSNAEAKGFVIVSGDDRFP